MERNSLLSGPKTGMNQTCSCQAEDLSSKGRLVQPRIIKNKQD